MQVQSKEKKSMAQRKKIKTLPSTRNYGGGYLAVVAPCRDGLDAGSVLGPHLVTAARGGAHLRARVVKKNQTDRQ